ncbi:MAG: hypothetical protein EA380_00770 [Phycisphaeraceae bacterium]|nr:MAG: hypothetical protein EA380_00770 [Phycisphaeraceae bacterium]
MFRKVFAPVPQALALMGAAAFLLVQPFLIPAISSPLEYPILTHSVGSRSIVLGIDPDSEWRLVRNSPLVPDGQGYIMSEHGGVMPGHLAHRSTALFECWLGGDGVGVGRNQELTALVTSGSVPDWIGRELSRGDLTPHAYAAVWVEYGIPFKFLAFSAYWEGGQRRFRGLMQPQKYPDPTVGEMLKPHPARRVLVVPALANLVFMYLTMNLFFVVCTLIIGFVRRHRGECVVCGYSLVGADQSFVKCPECGTVA